MEFSNEIIKLELVGDRKVNCYLVVINSHCLIVDPGYNKEYLREIIKNKNLTVDGILLTHCHVDHINAIDGFDVNIYLFESELEILRNNNINGYDLFNRKKPFDETKLKLIYVKDQEKIEFQNATFQVIHTPGHTPGSVCYQFKNYIFTGDTIFKNKVGDWRFEKGSLVDLKKSIIKLMDYHDDTILLPGHFENTTIAKERENNKFYLRTLAEINEIYDKENNQR